jgi:hypothetical protein
VIVGTCRILPAPHRRAHVLETLRAVRGPVPAQPGRTACHVSEEHGEEQAVALVEFREVRFPLEVSRKTRGSRERGLELK